MKKDMYYLVMKCECGELMFYRGVHHNFHFYTKDDGKSYASYDNEYLFECSNCGKQIKFDAEAQKDHYFIIRKCHKCGKIMEHHRGEPTFKCQKCGAIYDPPSSHLKNLPLEVDDAKKIPDWLKDERTTDGVKA